MNKLFEWDQNKNLLNLEKHGITFEEAVVIYEDQVFTICDKRKEYGELRFISIGKLYKRIVLVVVYTVRNARRRIISARKANASERRKYYANINKKTKSD